MKTEDEKKFLKEKKYGSLYVSQQKILDQFMKKHAGELGLGFSIDDYPDLYDALEAVHDSETLWQDINSYVHDNSDKFDRPWKRSGQMPWEDIDKFATSEEKGFLLEKRLRRLRTIFEQDIDKFFEYDEIKNITKRLGFETAREAWDFNPIVMGKIDLKNFVKKGDFNLEDIDKFATSEEKKFLGETSWYALQRPQPELTKLKMNKIKLHRPGTKKKEDKVKKVNAKTKTIEGKESLTEKWTARLSEVYDSFDEFKGYDEIYNLAKQLGFDSAEDAWLSNPKIQSRISLLPLSNSRNRLEKTQGSTDPKDYKVVDRGNSRKTNQKNEFEYDEFGDEIKNYPDYEPDRDLKFEDVDDFLTDDEREFLREDFDRTNKITEGANTKGKTRKVDDPYEVYKGDAYGYDDWEWRVLKHYQGPEKEKENPYARVMCAVKSPMTYGSWEYGDTYCKDIPGYKYEKEESHGGPDLEILPFWFRQSHKLGQN